jgi:hypothetical protein
MGKRGRAIFERRFTIDRSVDRIAGLYKTLVDAK